MNAMFKSEFALLDVMAGRAKLAKRLETGERIPVVIRGTITNRWGGDDGISIEFSVDVESVKELKKRTRR